VARACVVGEDESCVAGEPLQGADGDAQFGKGDDAGFIVGVVKNDDVADEGDEVGLGGAAVDGDAEPVSADDVVGDGGETFDGPAFGGVVAARVEEEEGLAVEPRAGGEVAGEAFLVVGEPEGERADGGGRDGRGCAVEGAEEIDSRGEVVIDGGDGEPAVVRGRAAWGVEAMGQERAAAVAVVAHADGDAGEPNGDGGGEGVGEEEGGIEAEGDEA